MWIHSWSSWFIHMRISMFNDIHGFLGMMASGFPGTVASIDFKPWWFLRISGYGGIHKFPSTVASIEFPDKVIVAVVKLWKGCSVTDFGENSPTLRICFVTVSRDKIRSRRMMCSRVTKLVLAFTSHKIMIKDVFSFVCMISHGYNIPMVTMKCVIYVFVCSAQTLVSYLT